MSATPAPKSSETSGGFEPHVPDAGADAPSPPTPPVYKNPFVIGFLIGIACLTILPFLQSGFLHAPEPIASLGDWSLLDEHGRPIGSRELKGQVWIASTFFTRCPSVCPKEQAAFSEMLRHFDDLAPPGVRLLSFTVDPEFDTPERLSAYAKKMLAPGGQWSFVTGSAADMKGLLVDKMRVGVSDKTPIEGTELFDIAHLARFILVDQNGDVRGYWPIDDEGRGNLINAARLLAKRGPHP